MTFSISRAKSRTRSQPSTFSIWPWYILKESKDKPFIKDWLAFVFIKQKISTFSSLQPVVHKALLLIRIIWGAFKKYLGPTARDPDSGGLGQAFVFLKISVGESDAYSGSKFCSFPSLANVPSLSFPKL